jgi:hypothetical protein
MSSARIVYIGFDPRFADAFAVARSSLSFWNRYMPVRGLVLADLRARGLYTRPTEKRDGRLWDTISEAPMATEFAISRFLVPLLAKSGWAAFCDCDMLYRANVVRAFEMAEEFRNRGKAVVCVKHDHRPVDDVKMDGQAQTNYARKNWSSFMLFNCDHPANKRLTVELVNTLPGRDLHRFCWLEDDEIGELGPEWNYLVGHTDPNVEPKVVHFTDGIPSVAGYEDSEYADDWNRELNRWAS